MEKDSRVKEDRGPKVERRPKGAHGRIAPTLIVSLRDELAAKKGHSE